MKDYSVRINGNGVHGRLVPGEMIVGILGELKVRSKVVVSVTSLVGQPSHMLLVVIPGHGPLLLRCLKTAREPPQSQLSFGILK
jgi:hypothetical protein